MTIESKLQHAHFNSEMTYESCTDARPLRKLLCDLPQKHPFLFLSNIREISPLHIIASHTFTGAEEFYRGHFPGDPVTPGVILIEMMAQAALVALGIYIVRQEQISSGKIQIRTLFSECSIEFLKPTFPGETLIVHGRRILWRRRKLRSQVHLVNNKGEIIAEGVVAGQGVPISDDQRSKYR